MQTRYSRPVFTVWYYPASTASVASFVGVCSFVSKQHTHTHLTALCPRQPRWASTRKVKLVWILLKQETFTGSDISWAICKSAPRSRQIIMPAPHHSGQMPFLPPSQQRQCTESHWRFVSRQWDCKLIVQCSPVVQATWKLLSLNAEIIDCFYSLILADRCLDVEELTTPTTFVVFPGNTIG